MEASYFKGEPNESVNQKGNRHITQVFVRTIEFLIRSHLVFDIYKISRGFIAFPWIVSRKRAPL